MRVIIPIVAVLFFIAWVVISSWLLFWKCSPEQKAILDRLIAKTKIGALDWKVTETTMNEECYETLDSELGLEYSFYNWGKGSGVIYDHRFLHIWSAKEENSRREYKYHIGITPAHLLKQLEDEIVIKLGFSAKTKTEMEKEAGKQLAEVLKIKETN